MVDFPNVPNLPGVPVLYRQVGQFIAPVQYAVADFVAQTAYVEQKWGLYTVDGDIALTVDSVVAIDYNKEYNIPSYPIEDGSFETYNKVELPYEATLIVTRGGDMTDRMLFQDMLNTLLSSLLVFDLVTPERTYVNANIIGLKIGRSATKGANLVTAEMRIKEVRIGADAEFSNTKSDNAANTVDTGAVQGQTPSSATTTAATGPNTIGS